MQIKKHLNRCYNAEACGIHLSEQQQQRSGGSAFGAEDEKNGKCPLQGEASFSGLAPFISELWVILRRNVV